MGSIAAIPTEYQYTLFRSRMEARWAVFFDRLNIRFEYEWQPYKTSCGAYLPDFYIPLLGAFIELKPAPPDIVQETKIAELSLGTDDHPVISEFFEIGSWCLVGDPLSSLTSVSDGGTWEFNNAYYFRSGFDLSPLANRILFDVQNNGLIWNEPSMGLGPFVFDLYDAVWHDVRGGDLRSTDIEDIYNAAEYARRYQFWRAPRTLH